MPRYLNKTIRDKKQKEFLERKTELKQAGIKATMELLEEVSDKYVPRPMFSPITTFISLLIMIIIVAVAAAIIENIRPFFSGTNFNGLINLSGLIPTMFVVIILILFAQIFLDF